MHLTIIPHKYYLEQELKFLRIFPDFKLIVLFVAYSAITFLKIKIFPIMIHHLKAWTGIAFDCMYIHCCK